MNELRALIMGVVEGLTEFLPVSSTGHLILAGHWLGFDQSLGSEVAGTFAIVIQLGAILAIVAAFPERFRALLSGDRSTGGFAGWRGLALLGLTTLPALAVGGLLHGTIKRHLFQPHWVAVGLAVGAVWILIVEWRRLKSRTEGLDALGWREALGVGLFQCLAMWPGMSRSGASIMGGMMLGIDRRTATEYSFFAAVPVLCAAALADLAQNFSLLDASHVRLLAIGLLVSFAAALLAVKCLLRYVGSHSLSVFAWYRLALAALVLLLAPPA